MMSNALRILLTILALALLLPIHATAHWMTRSATNMEMEEIVNAKQLSSQEKIEKLSAYFAKEPNWQVILYRLDRVDKALVKQIAIRLFRKSETSRINRIEVARYLLGENIPGFNAEYRSFLIDAILNGGVNEFFKPRDEDTHTAVGEYAYIASGLNAPRGITFDEVKDARVLPALIRCLDAPDDVYPKHQGDIIWGKPGDFTGRNTQRQGIPVALAKQNATEAVSKLQEILFTHHDYWLRYNAAYALAVLLPREESLIIEKRLLGTVLKNFFQLNNFQLNNKKLPMKQFLFPFGAGLIDKGLDDGIRFMSFEFSVKPDDRSLLGALYMAEQRVALVEAVRSRKVESFYREVLEHPVLYEILLFNAEKIQYSYNSVYDYDKAKVLKSSENRIIDLYRKLLVGMKVNGINSLSNKVAAIAEKTANAEIRKSSEEFLAELRENKKQ